MILELFVFFLFEEISKKLLNVCVYMSIYKLESGGNMS